MTNIAPAAFAPTPAGLRSPLHTGIIFPSGVTFTAQPRKRLCDS